MKSKKNNNAKRIKKIIPKNCQAEESLRQSEEKFRQELKLKNELEEGVKERTLDLQNANDILRYEIAARKRVENELAERLKELQCLYRINKLDDDIDLGIESLYKQSILIIPSGYRNSDDVCVKIMVNGKSYQTPNWENLSQTQISNIKSEGLIIGHIEVGYITASKPENAIFLNEEQEMLDAVGELLGSISRRRSSEYELVKNRERLSTAIQASGAGIYEFSTYPESYYCNTRWAEIIGYKVEELPRAGHFMNWLVNQIHPEDRHEVFKAFKINFQNPDQKFDTIFRVKHKSGEWKYVHCISESTASEENKNSYQTNGIMLDVTEVKQTERRILLNNEIMKLFWLSVSVKDYLTEVVNLIYKWSQCRCVGVRLRDPDTAGIPYIAYKGFDDTFVKSESMLSLERDNCICIRAISQNHEDQDSKVITQSGSWYLKNAIDYINNLSQKERTRYRGTCMQNGFKTIAVIPIKHQKIIFGAIHLADKNESALSLTEIKTLEDVANLIGQGLYRLDIEARIRTNQKRLASAQQIAHLGNWEWDLRKNKLNWSDEVYRIFGQNAQEFVPTREKFLAFVHRDDRVRIEKTIEKALNHQQPYNIEYRILLSDGTTGYAYEQGVVNTDASGQPLRMSGTIQDISARKMLENQLLESSNYARTLIEVTLDPMVTISADGKIMDANRATENATGLSRNQLIGTDFANYFSEPEKAREGYQKVFSDGYVRDYPLVLRSVNGSMIDVLYNASLYRNSVGEVQGVFAAARDITQLKRIEEELHALSRQIVNAQENERRSIARELHDEIGQSLTVLKILIAQAERQPEEKRANTLKDTYKLATELLQQVRELSLNLRPSMLDDLGLLPTLIWHFDKFTAQTGIRINFEHEGLETPLPPEVVTTVYRIIQEALTNVVRYAGVNEASVNLNFNNDALFIRIEDKGIGFSLPQTNTRATAGISGMRERVLLLGGRIILDTAPQKGTRVLVELPIGNKVDLMKK